MCNKSLPTAVQILRSVLVEDNLGIIVHYLEFNVFLLFRALLAVAQWLSYYATNRKVADSIPDGVIGIFH
jgi:hypothetical protein